jgi:hypothetical protein
LPETAVNQADGGHSTSARSFADRLSGYPVHHEREHVSRRDDTGDGGTVHELKVCQGDAHEIAEAGEDIFHFSVTEQGRHVI